ncbi:aa3-type cytochrome c oxidase subunit IV [Caulobacter sp. DWR2-3-1b2]|uniref:aa3-type cytochrome c oxidase subunit IV n=1 Tax=unclassified Caulobacter TaxID=2648921 RepID=UPI00199BD1F9|nr:aa3-type cytochrome c oxidase subunit IV [Caulobacter sp.]
MDADFNDAGKPDLLAHEQTYHGFSILLRWCMLGLATVISALTVCFATPGGFLGAVAVGIAVFAVGYAILVRHEEKQPLSLWVEGR